MFQIAAVTFQQHGSPESGTTDCEGGLKESKSDRGLMPGYVDAAAKCLSLALLSRGGVGSLVLPVSLCRSEKPSTNHGRTCISITS